jgi:hypothetical protein
VATGLDVVTRLAHPEIQALCRDSPEILRALTLKIYRIFRGRDLRPWWHLSASGRASNWPRLMSELLTLLQSGLSEPLDRRTNPLPDSRETFERALVLRPAMRGFRRLVSLAWRPDTACPGYVTQSHSDRRNPLGQCGVTSVWLADLLAYKYSIRSTFCYGSLTFGPDTVENLYDHCWLEIGEPSGENLILDLTCSQARGLNWEVVFDSRTNLDRQEVHYSSREHIDFLDLTDNPVLPRYDMLLFNMIPSLLAAFGGLIGLTTFLCENTAEKHSLRVEGVLPYLLAGPN